MKSYFATVLLYLFAFAHPGFSQDKLSYEVYINYPPLSISREKLNEAHSISDLNSSYKSSWIRKFISVEISASHNGKIIKSQYTNDALSQEQKDLISKADAGTDISVRINYIPQNTLSHNDPKEFNFRFSLHPDTEASYVGGQQKLKSYLKNKAIDKISAARFYDINQYNLVAIKFTIDEAGQIVNTNIFQSSKDEKIDELLLDAICSMPLWKPAEYSNGIKVQQELVFTVGNMENCMVNLLNIQQE